MIFYPVNLTFNSSFIQYQPTNPVKFTVIFPVQPVFILCTSRFLINKMHISIFFSNFTPIKYSSFIFYIE